MKKRASLLILTLFGVSILVAVGCGPTRSQIMMDQTMSARVNTDPDYNECARFLKEYLEKHDKDYVMWGMDYSSLCLMAGNYDEARIVLDRCNKDIRDRVDTKAQQKAALSNESMKIFRGEPFEKAMVCSYLGLINYVDGDYNAARIYFTNADLADATTCDDMKDYRHDFRLAHYWLGRSFMKLGKDDNAKIAFDLAAKRIARKGEDRESKRIQKQQVRERKQRISLEKKCFDQATKKAKTPVEGVADMSNSSEVAEMPLCLAGDAAGNESASPFLSSTDSFEQFLTLDYQKQVNLILVIETGNAPIKFLETETGCMDYIVRAPYEERRVMVYLDGYKGGCAFQMVDLFHQADTRGTSEKDRVQMAKGVTKSVLARMPYVSYAAKLWDVRADHRYWHLMPGEVHVFAARVKPGLYTLRLECFDSNGFLLPRYSLTRYYVPVQEGQDNVYLLHVKKEADNVYVADTKK